MSERIKWWVRVVPSFELCVATCHGRTVIMLISKTPVETRERTFAGIRGAGTAPTETDLALDDSKAAAWVQAYDAAWLGRRWSALEKIFAADVTLVSTDFAQAIVGRETALNHVRNLMARTHVHEYTTAALKGYTSGAVGIITYCWQLDWTVDRERRSGAGRDILVLQPAATGWELTWRGRTVRQRPGAIGNSAWPSE
jgi:hypothetical protein